MSLFTVMSNSGTLMAKAGAELPPFTESRTYSASCYTASIFLAVFIMPFCAGLMILLSSIAAGNVSYISFALISQSCSMLGVALSQVREVKRTKDSFVFKRFGGSFVVVPLSDVHSVELSSSCGMRIIRINFTESYVAKMAEQMAGSCRCAVADNEKLVLDHISEFTSDHGMVALSDVEPVEIRAM